MRAELKGLSLDNASVVGRHILMAGGLIDTDPELAYQHADAARRRASRIPVVREAVAETAYASSHYDVALREYRALRRMTGGPELIPVIADCERALGRPREALEVLKELTATRPPADLRIEGLLVEAGVRKDLGQAGEAQRLLRQAVSQPGGSKSTRARLIYAYADLLESQGHMSQARAAFSQAAALDTHAELDGADRLAALDGVVLPEDLTLDDDAATLEEQ
ncbi:MAG: hypothetical protein ACK5KO_00670 [Arachnia sp.]